LTGKVSDMTRKDDRDYLVPPSEADLFTDREEFLDAFEKALIELTHDAPKVLVFYGPAGIGKTAIRKRLERGLENEEYGDGIGWGTITFEPGGATTADAALARLAGSFQEKRDIRFPSFEVGFGTYLRKNSPGASYERDRIPLLRIGKAAFNIAGILDDQIATLGILAEYLLDDDSLNWFDNWRRTLGREYLRGIEYIEPEDVKYRLPQYFGLDLQDYVKKKKRVVVFLDGYEGVWKSESHVRLEHDEWVRKLIEFSPGVVFVITSRRAVVEDNWETLDDTDITVPFDLIEEKYVDDFKLDDSRKLLERAEIADEEIVKRISKGSEGIPFYLERCIDIYYGKLNDGGTPTPEDFPSTQRKILERFLRDFDDKEQVMFEVLGCARFIEERLFEELIDEFELGYSPNYFKNFVKYSFVVRDTESDPHRIHELLRIHLMDVTDTYFRVKVHTFLFDYYKATAEVDDPKTITDENLTALGEALYHGLETGEIEGVADWFNVISHIYEEAAIYAEVASFYEWFIGKIENDVPDDSIPFATALNNLASLYRQRGLYTESERYYLKAIEIIEKAFGSNYPELAITVSNLAGVYKSLSRYGEAEPLYVRALKTLEEKWGLDHPEVAKALNNLAELYRLQKRHEEAEPLFERAIRILSEKPGVGGFGIAYPLNNLGLLYGEQEQYEKAEEYFRKALVIIETEKGSNHPDLATILNNLAGVKESQHSYGEAEPLYKRAIGVLEEKLGLSHPSLANTLNNLAYLYVKMGKYEEALEHQQRTLQIYEKVLPNNHPDIINSYIGISNIYAMLGQLGDAIEHFRRAEELQALRNANE
jgi:tetratricopeptide (TPR) repeat protein